MGNGRIKIDTAAVRSAATNVGRLNKCVNHSLDELTRQISALNKDWDGSASEQAISTFSKMRSDYYENRYAQVDNFVRFLLQNVAGGYEFAESNNSKLADLFK